MDARQELEELRRLDELESRAAAANPPEKVDFGQSVAIGAGRTLDQLAAGLRQATPAFIRNPLDRLNAALGMGAPPSIDPAVQAQNKAIYEGMAKQQPVGSFIGEALPTAATANPLALGGLGALEYGTPQERAIRGGAGWAGGKIGQAIGSGASRLFGPESASITPKLADEFFPGRGNQWNIPLSVGQRTQSKPAQIVESVVSNLPGGAGVMARAQDRTFGQFNRAVANTFGESATRLTPEVLGKAREKIGGKIGEIASRNQLYIDDTFAKTIAQQSAEAASTLTDDALKVYSRQIDDLLGKAGQEGVVTGKFYQSLDTKLGRMAKGTQDGNLKHALGELRTSMRDAFDRSVSKADFAEWTKARKQYANLMTIANAAKNTGDGALSPARLLQAVNEAQPTARFGSGTDLSKLAQWAKSTLPDKIPNSGTAQRLFYQKLISNPLTTLGAAGGLGYGAEQAGIGSEAALGIPLAYLTARGMAGRPTSQFTEELLKRLGGGLLGSAVLTKSP